MANFTYANSAVVSQMFTHLQSTSFPGISVCDWYNIIIYLLFVTASCTMFYQGNEVRFNKEGTRDVDTVAIRQYHPNPDGMCIYIDG